MSVATTTEPAKAAEHLLDFWFAGAIEGVDHLVVSRKEPEGWRSTSLPPSRSGQAANLAAAKALEHNTYVRHTAIGRHLDSPRERGKVVDTSALFGLVLDIDGEWGVHKHDSAKTGLRLPATPEEALAPLELFPPAAIVDSGGGFYALWPLAEPLRDLDAIRSLLERWSDHWIAIYGERGLHLDAVHDAARVIRWPGTLNHKFADADGVHADKRGPARPVTLVSLDPSRRWNADDISAWLPELPPPLGIDRQHEEAPYEDGSSDYAFDVLRRSGAVGHRLIANALVAEGWEEIDERNPGDDRLIDLLRPGGSSERSVTLGGLEDDYAGRVEVWSDAVPGIRAGHYTIGTLATTVLFDGDTAACATWLAEHGYGAAERPAREWDLDWADQFTLGAQLRGLEDIPAAGDPAPGEPTSWEPIDLRNALRGEGPTPPTILRHTRGHHLLYPGRSHWFIGASESCKSWAEQAAAAEVLMAGGNVLYIDYEDDERGVVSRLVSLGVPHSLIIDGLCYIRPNEPLMDRQGRYTPGGLRFQALLTERPWALGIIDGVTESMATEGLDPNDNSDAALFNRRIMRPIADVGAAAVAIDHQPKNAGETGRFAIGAQHKLAGLTGAAYRFEVQRPFGRALGAEPNIGLIKVTVSKDRPGYVRGRSPEGTVALFRLTSYPDGGVDAEFVDAADLGDEGADMSAALAILQHLDTYEGESGRRLEDSIAGNSQTIRAAVKWLIGKGWVRVEKQGQRHAHYLTEQGRREGLNG